MCPVPDYTLYIVVPLPIGGEHARTVSDLIKRSEYSLNQFLSCVDWVNVHNTLHMPPNEKSRGVRSGDLGGRATGPPLPIHFSL